MPFFGYYLKSAYLWEPWITTTQIIISLWKVWSQNLFAEIIIYSDKKCDIFHLNDKDKVIKSTNYYAIQISE